MNKEKLVQELQLRGIAIDDKKVSELLEFMNYTLVANQSFNLTSITDEEQFVEKMIFDSALGLYDFDITDKKVLDLGTGAGYPGMVLAILEKDAKVTLLDSTKKKIDHLAKYISEHKYNIETVADRAEHFAKDNREKYDVVVARAVTQLPILLELAMPLLKVGGTLIAYKGPEAFNEIKQSEKAMKKLKCHFQKTYEDVLPESLEKRCLVYIVKDAATPNKYPREYNEIKKLPL